MMVSSGPRPDAGTVARGAAPRDDTSAVERKQGASSVRVHTAEFESGGCRAGSAEAGSTNGLPDGHAHVVEAPALVARPAGLLRFALVQAAREDHRRGGVAVRHGEGEMIRGVTEPECVAERVHSGRARL